MGINGNKQSISDHYHYAYMPYAKVIQGGRGFILEVEGMNDSVRVRRVY